MRKALRIAVACVLAMAAVLPACDEEVSPGGTGWPAGDAQSLSNAPGSDSSAHDASGGGTRRDAGGSNDASGTAPETGSDDALGPAIPLPPAILPPAGKTDYAPYYYIAADSDAFGSLVDLQRRSGLNEVSLAFVLSGGNCSTDDTIPSILSDVNAFVAGGGHVKATFGGAGGTYVESECSDASSLAAAIGAFVDATGITDLDFDIEEDPARTDAMNMMRGQALKMVQDSRGVRVAFTLESNAPPNGGLDAQGISVVTQALAAGVAISHINLMVMDFGNMPLGTALAPIVIGSLTDGNAQLMKIIPGLTSAQAWTFIGATPMIGNNDDNEVFSLADARALATFAIQNRIGLVSFWNIQRDEAACQNPCSGLDNSDFDFHNILKTVQ